MQINPDNIRDFRNALGGFPTGVTIITAQGGNGALAGMTASSFNTVSMDPPLILWSITRGATYFPVFDEASHFSVNVLAEDQQELSNGFAKEGKKPFDGISFGTGLGGAPLFDGCVAQFQCETWAKYDGGDHVIIVGKVIEFESSDKTPLVFAGGGYKLLTN
ncbi:MAG: flavin reductase [Alphaproteobacteria bacterium]|nr:MAG: flavin reductase [Alphaproteobacteria bacterium]